MQRYDSVLCYATLALCSVFYNRRSGTDLSSVGVDLRRSLNMVFSKCSGPLGWLGEHVCVAWCHNALCWLRSHMLASVREIVLILLVFGIGLMWLWAGIGKFYTQFWIKNSRFALSADKGVGVLHNFLLPAIEVLLGLALLLRYRVLEAALISVILLFVFTAVQFYSLVRRSITNTNSLGCGCFGGSNKFWRIPSSHLGEERRELTEKNAAWNFVRNLILISISWVILMNQLFPLN